MFTEPLNLEAFIIKVLSTQEAGDIAGSWRIDSKKIEEYLCNAVRSMGIFVVHEKQVKSLQEMVLALLKFSPEISDMVRRAEKDIVFRSTKRHSD